MTTWLLSNPSRPPVQVTVRSPETWECLAAYDTRELNGCAPRPVYDRKRADFIATRARYGVIEIRHIEGRNTQIKRRKVISTGLLESSYRRGTLGEGL
jgi:hypothetical protein